MIASPFIASISPPVSANVLETAKTAATLTKATMTTLAVAPANRGRFAKARKLHFKLLPDYKVLVSETNPIGIKTALAVNKANTEELRLPLNPMGDANKARLRAVARKPQL